MFSILGIVSLVWSSLLVKTGIAMRMNNYCLSIKGKRISTEPHLSKGEDSTYIFSQSFIIKMKTSSKKRFKYWCREKSLVLFSVQLFHSWDVHISHDGLCFTYLHKWIRNYFRSWSLTENHYWISNTRHWYYWVDFNSWDFIKHIHKSNLH